MSSTSPSSTTPSVVVSGGGPAGLVAAIMLAKRCGIQTTVVERSATPDEWSTKSYSIVLGDRGLTALQQAECYDAIRQYGMPRNFVVMHDKDGNTKQIPKRAKESIGFSRPILVKALEDIAREQDNITILKGSGVERVDMNGDGEDSLLQVVLDDGTSIQATHVIGADGKWSAVRSSFPNDFIATIHTEPSFGVHIMVPSVPQDWNMDATHVIRPRQECKFYVIAAPIPTGELSVSIVCYDETLSNYPWLAPPKDAVDEKKSDEMNGWENQYSALPANVDSNDELVENLTTLLEEELPFFLEAIGKDSLKTARINRRVSWVELTNPSNSDDVSFATSDGKVCLIGDAAHGVTPSLGEGCNLAIESAVSLVECIPSDNCVTTSGLTKAFLEYGKSRPLETEPIQTKSAVACRYATRIGA